MAVSVILGFYLLNLNRLPQKMSKTLSLCFATLLALALGLHAHTATAQNGAKALGCNDLYYLGRTLLDGNSDLTAQSFQQPDMHTLALALQTQDLEALQSIKSQDVYFMGRGLLMASTQELENIADDNLYFMALAVLQNDISILDENLPHNTDLYYLGLALLEGDNQYLNAMSCRK